MRFTVLLVDDHPLVLEALRIAVARTGEFRVNSATTIQEARESLRRAPPDVLVCDIRLPDGNGLSLIEEIATSTSTTACIVLSSFDTVQYIATARRLGAAGYLLKTEPTDAIIGAIRKVAAGGTAFSPSYDPQAAVALTDREREVVRGVVSGETNDEIAGRLGISRRGVEAHLSHIYARVGAASKTELAVRAERESWLDDA